MERLFKNILLPVHFNRRAEVTAEKAIHFANQMQCNLHLLHVIPVTPFREWMDSICEYLGIRVTHTAIKQEVYRWQTKFAGQLNKGQLFFINLEKGDPGEKINQYIESHEIDMILATEEAMGITGFIPDENQHLHYAILTLATKLELRDLKTIVLPVGKTLALNKIRVAAYLAKEFGASIHLVAIDLAGKKNDELPYMKRAFRILNDNTDLQIICSTLNGRDPGTALIQYGKTVNADLVVANPMDIWRKQDRSIFHRLTRKDFSLPILAVN